MIDAYHYGDGIFVKNDPSNDSIFWTGGKYGYMSVCRSTDAGFFWTRYNLSENDGWAFAMDIDPNNSNVVYTGGDPDLHRTTDFGTTWTTIMNGLTGFTYAIKIDPQSTNTIYAGTSDGVFRSDDYGDNWYYCGIDDVYTLEINPNSSDTLYAGTINGVFRSNDAGSSWRNYSEGLEDGHITSMAMNPMNYLFTGTYCAGLYRSDIQVPVAERKPDNSKSWVIMSMANPIRKNTLIRLKISTDENLQLKIFDHQGRMIRELNPSLSRGEHTILFDGKDGKGMLISSGVYFFQASTKTNSLYHKFIYIK